MLDIPAWSTRGDLIDAGVSDADLRRLRQRDAHVRLRHGRYLTDPRAEMSPELRHLTRAVEIGRSLRSGGVLSHCSAALVHGLPVPGPRLDRVDVTWPSSPGRRPTHNIRPHRARVHDGEITTVDDVMVTSVARTVYDIARSRDIPKRSALAIADAALHRGLCLPDDLAQVIRANGGRPGCNRAREVVAFADPRAESVGESFTRAFLGFIGAPTPDLQVEVDDARQPAFARLDFLFFDLDTAAEFDGKVKFSRYLRPGETAADAVFREKVREDRIRDCGLQVVRFIWADLSGSATAQRRLGDAFARAGFRQWRPGPPRFLP